MELIYFEKLKSTQNKAKQLKKDKTVIIANVQTEGIGTHGRAWESEKGKNITMTVVFLPNFNVKILEGLTLEIAEIIKKSIFELYNIKLTIKKPNDLLLNDKKICGILTESVIISNIVKELYIGIGFNVNQDYFNEELKNIATSLKKETEKYYHIEDIINKIINNIETAITNKKNTV